MTSKARIFLTGATVWVVVSIVVACASNDLGPAAAVECDGVEIVSFADDIQPILNTKCAIPDCHNGDMGDDLNWTVPATFQAHASEARRRVLLPDTDPDQMPKEGSISDEQIKLIVCWAEQGAPIDN